MKRNAVAWAALVVSSAALVSSSGLIRPMPAAPSVPAESQKTARALSEAFIAVAEFVKPSVVQISVQRKASVRRQGPGQRSPSPGPNMQPKDFEDLLKRFFGPDFEPQNQQFQGPIAEGTGSGFVYDDKGHILTNNHVVEGSGKITVKFNDGVEVAATVVGTDRDSDVAVLKVDNTNYRPLPKGSSARLKVGELVMAIGSPFGLSQTVTTGIISATERNDVGINSYESFLQTDAAINPGNSGGPLVNMEGQVIGIDSAIVTGSRGNDGVGFAIPIDMASHVADKLIKNGKVSRARVGILLGVLSPAMAKQFGIDPKTKGVMVESVLPGSPAEKAGLKSGDVIVEFDGNPVVNVPSFRLTVASSEAGKSFKLSYYREGKIHTTTITPAPSEQVPYEAERSRDVEKPESAQPEKTEVKDFGFEVQALTPELAKQFGLKSGVQGLLISSVKDGSPAEAAGLEAGMVISKVVRDHRPQAVKSVKDLQDVISKSDDVAVYIESSKGPGHFVTLTKAKKD